MCLSVNDSEAGKSTNEPEFRGLEAYASALAGLSSRSDVSKRACVRLAGATAAASAPARGSISARSDPECSTSARERSTAASFALLAGIGSPQREPTTIPPRGHHPLRPVAAFEPEFVADQQDGANPSRYGPLACLTCAFTVSTATTFGQRKPDSCERPPLRPSGTLVATGIAGPAVRRRVMDRFAVEFGHDGGGFLP